MVTRNPVPRSIGCPSIVIEAERRFSCGVLRPDDVLCDLPDHAEANRAGDRVVALDQLLDLRVRRDVARDDLGRALQRLTDERDLRPPDVLDLESGQQRVSRASVDDVRGEELEHGAVERRAVLAAVSFCTGAAGAWATPSASVSEAAAKSTAMRFVTGLPCSGLDVPYRVRFYSVAPRRTAPHTGPSPDGGVV